MLKEKSCGAVVYRRRTDNGIQILLIKHRNGGHWSFPKGHVEFGESEHETAIREIKEETGLNVQLRDGFRHSVVYSPRPHSQKEVVYFLASAENGPVIPQEEEISKAIWVNIDRAEKMVTFENDKALIQNAKKYIVSRTPQPSKHPLQ